MRVEVKPVAPASVPLTKPRNVRPDKAEKPKRRIKQSFFGTIRLLFTLAVIGGILYAVYLIGSIPKRYNILVIGSDQRSDEPGRSDVLMVVSLTKSPTVPPSIVTIPRDTRVEVPGHGLQKITHAYAFDVKRTDGKDLGNKNLTKQVAEDLLHVHVDATVEVTFASFQQIIDRLGGVTTQANGKLNGEEALKIVRDRFREGGDFARTADQREILVQTVREVKGQNAFSIVYDFLKNSSESRITINESQFLPFFAYAVIRRGGSFSLAGIHTDVVPGAGKMIYTPDFGKELYYWVPDAAATKKLVHDWLS